MVSALRGAVLRIAASDPEASRGDAEGIHRLRTSTRRLRSELRAFEEMVESRWREEIEDELKWLASLLGGVRDLDILLGRLRKAALGLEGPDAQALASLFSTLESRHDGAASALNTGLESDRYRGLISALKRAVEHPGLTDAAREPCRIALPSLVAASWRRLKKGARGLKRSDPDEEFHEVRKRAKRARYTAELVAPILGPRVARAAGRFIRLATQVQDVLGEHHDAIVAALEIDRALAERGDDPAFTQAAARLLETQREAARAARAAFFDVWEKLDRRKSTRWMKRRANAGARAKS